MTPLAFGIILAAFAFVSIVGFRAIGRLNERVTALESPEYVKQLEQHIQGLGDQVLEAIRRQRDRGNAHIPVEFDRLFIVITPEEDSSAGQTLVVDEFAS